jgi:hypothetical protein
MPTWLTVLLIVLGVLGIGVGLLVWIFFHQGGCCIRKAATKLSRRACAVPALKQD